MVNEYLDIAEKAIRVAGRPLHPKEILSIARKNGDVPPHLGGKTPHKTLAARLSVDIRKFQKSSKFYRTAKNIFFLRELKDSSTPEYSASARRKHLHSEYVLTVPDNYIRETGVEQVFSNISEFLRDLHTQQRGKYVIRKLAEKSFDVKQIVAYAVIYRAGHILTYRRGTFSNASDELQGMRSIGFGGHVTNTDMNLFDLPGLGVIEAARREISEELLISPTELNEFLSENRYKFLCGINSYESVDAQKHLAAVVVYFCSDNFVPKKNEMSINDLSWISIESPANSLEDYELWSKLILESLYNGDLKID